MDIMEAIHTRHSVRSYLDKPIPQALREKLDALAANCNQTGNLHISIQYDDPDGFDSRLAHYGHFRNVRNYIVLAGNQKEDFAYRCGYYGEQLVLLAQTLGLNTCWAAMTFNRKKVRALLEEGDTLCMVIALGYGENQGVPRKSKSLENVIEVHGPCPDWFVRGVEAALEAPTAVNQQKFLFALENGQPVARVNGIGTNTKVDLGIAACHFEIASGKRVLHR